VCVAEKLAYEADALQLLAEAADGSMRDALSLLDQTIAFCGENIATHDTRQMLGSVEQDTLLRLVWMHWLNVMAYVCCLKLNILQK